MKRLLIIFSMLMVLLCGCNTPSEPTNILSIDYGWMAGESPVSPERTGTYNNAIDQLQNGFEVTESGCYWMCDGILLYSDHGSDEVIRLCGRPDCMHNNMSCNAHFLDGKNVCYYDGYLFVTQGSNLIRLNTDGSGRVTLLNPLTLLNTGVMGYYSPHIWNGIYSVGLKHLDENGNLVVEQFYTALSGDFSTMEQMEVCRPAQTDGSHYIVMNEDEWCMKLWDSKANQTTYICEATGRGYYGAEENWYIQDGTIYRNVYEENVPEPMFDTGLSGGHALHCFHDCIVVSNYPTDEQWANYEKVKEQVLRFYNWNFEFLGEVTLNYPGALDPYNPICGESHERIYLSDNTDDVPRYYIDKTDLGTDNITIHKLNLPEDIEQMLDEDGGVELPFGG